MVKIAKKLERFGFLDPIIRQSLEKLLTDMFVDKPSVFDVLISPDISIEAHWADEWKIDLTVQVIWAEANVWVRPITLSLKINKAGSVFFRRCLCDDFPTRDRFFGLVKEPSLWKDHGFY